ncbi:MAG: hypothetical protein U9N30_03315 [Campylobacterota bacterium]|nr:hypothetical protein [Campylobacterota bacterium]
MFQGLSTDQAPPISVPFRFFIMAPIFGMIMSVIMFIYPLEEIFNQYSAVTIGLVHLFTLGILAQMIMGALQQMLPVLAGAVVKKPMLFANIVHLPLSFGTLSLSAGFILSSKIYLIIGSALLSIAFAVFFFVVIKLLFKVKYLTTTVNAMKIFSLAGLITVLLGLYLAGQHISGNINAYHYIFVDTHIAFGMFGFAVILIMGVAFQVIPMFYVARDFPKFVQNKFPRVLFGMLGLYGVFSLLGLNSVAIKVIFAILLIVFAIYGLISLNNRRRNVFDITLWYWKFSLFMLIVAMLIYTFGSVQNNAVLAIVFGIGFLFSLLQGMVYKIIPFLAWFHLSSKGHFDIPTLRDFIKEFAIKLQFFIYGASVFFFILSTFIHFAFIYIAAGLFFVSNLMLLINFIVAMKKFYRINKLDPMVAFK